MLLENKVAIVTGGARGIGFACAQRLAREGAQVVIADIDDEAGEASATGINEAQSDTQGEARYVHCNVSERLDINNLIKLALDMFGSIDVLVNNAGIVHKADFLDIEEEDFDRVMGINLKGSFLTGQAVARTMVEQVAGGGAPGAIINMSSINAVFAIADQVPYSVSKGGLNQLTKVMALALAPHGIRVNAIGPGSIMTDMLKVVNESDEARRKLLARTPLLRIGEPEEIAAVAAFLASDEASYITGQTLYADGGRLGLNYTVEVPDDI